MRKKKGEKYNVAGYLGMGLLGAAGAAALGRFLLEKTISATLTRIMTESYEKNLWEVFSASARTTPQLIVETNLRAETGKPIQRPLAGPRRMLDFSGLMFNVAQLETFPTPGDVPVDTTLVLGKRAARPLKLAIPILIAGMAYSIALSERVKVALAKVATMAGTATNTDLGPFLPAEREAATHLIVQYARTTWNKAPEILRQADMLELQFGQGAWAGASIVVSTRKIDARLRKALGIGPHQDAVSQARMPGLASPAELGRLVKELRELTGGVPIGVKLAAGNDLEKDLHWAIAAGVDVITIDGAQDATAQSYPILQDDFGLPTLYAPCRAVLFLEKKGVRNDVSLIISGGLATPGDYLKALALGADGVTIGTLALFAVTHTQVFNALPFEPPVEVVYYQGRRSQEFDAEKGARHLANYLLACIEEMKEGARALGKTALRDVNKNDLLALDERTALVTGVRPGWDQTSALKSGSGGK